MQKPQRGDQPGFAPVWNAHSRVLILGSYPSPQSFVQGFYYGHPQNRFWPLLAAMLGEAPPQSIEAKRSLLLRQGIALWDVLESCTITGAADSSIRNGVPNDIAGLLGQTRIGAVFCNGRTAHTLYTRFVQPHTGLPAQALPSTSPANAAFSMARLREAWQPLQAALSQPAE